MSGLLQCSSFYVQCTTSILRGRNHQFKSCDGGSSSQRIKTDKGRSSWPTVTEKTIKKFFPRHKQQGAMCVYLKCPSRSDWLRLSLLFSTDSQQLEWSSFSRHTHMRRGDSHSSWVAASSWSPGWRGCGPGWTGWFCPCTAAGVGWFPPAPSVLPLTVDRERFTHVLNAVHQNRSKIIFAVFYSGTSYSWKYPVVLATCNTPAIIRCMSCYKTEIMLSSFFHVVSLPSYWYQLKLAPSYSTSPRFAFNKPF